MVLVIQIDELNYDVDVPDRLIQDAEDLYQKMDKDMDQGWQLSRDWVAHPDAKQRCQIVADKVLDAIEKQNEKVTIMMCGYILSRMPGSKRVIIDTSGDIGKTEISSA